MGSRRRCSPTTRRRAAAPTGSPLRPRRGHPCADRRCRARCRRARPRQNGWPFPPRRVPPLPRARPPEPSRQSSCASDLPSPPPRSVAHSRSVCRHIPRRAPVDPGVTGGPHRCQAGRVIDWSAIDSVVGQNWYQLDPDLQARVRRDCPADDLEWAVATLDSFGGLIGDRVARAADVIDAHPPELVRYDRWANEVGEVAHHPAMLDAKRALWEAGYPSGFAPQARERGRPTPGVVLGAASYLLSEADTGMVCSLGMTSGVAGLVDAYAPPDVREELLAGLRAADVDDAVDGSMFLTERDGGSDLGRTVHCTARELGDGRVEISGEKWFCSNVDGAAIVLLARPEGAPSGSAGLGLYLVPRTLEDGTPNRYSIRRLKQKLGTKSVPTGEVTFDGAVAYALRPQRPRDDGETGAPVDQASSDAGGLNRMMEMVNGSRFGVAMMGLGIARRSFAEATAWAHHRQAKGRALVDLPLVREQLVDQLAELEAAVALGFESAAAGRAADGRRLRRILVPAAKV